MKSAFSAAIAFALIPTLAWPAVGQQVAEACNGRMVSRTGPNGKTLTLCLDGRYSTCLRDSQRLGYSYESAKRYCDSRPNLKK
jgi:hypothetical protein